MEDPRLKTGPPRVVLDTHLVLSALLFRGPTLMTLRQGWQDRKFIVLISKATVGELIRVLSYPKFHLNPGQREDLLADYLPFCQSIRVPIPAPVTPPCQDPFDVPFLELALAGNADYLLTGDSDLLILAEEFYCPIVKADRFLKEMEK